MSFDFNKVNVYPPRKTWDDIYETWKTKVNAITSHNILSGFTHTHKGTEYKFSYKLEDQTNFANGNGDALLSIQLQNTPMETLKSTYGTKKDGSLDESKLPTPLPTTWKMVWRGYIDGVAHDLALSPTEFVALSAAGGAHNKKCLGDGWATLAKLQATKEAGIGALNKLAEELSIDNTYYAIMAK